MFLAFTVVVSLAIGALDLDVSGMYVAALLGLVILGSMLFLVTYTAISRWRTVSRRSA
ncbi:MAG: hypothetical protein ACRDSK_07425 [Actinophytocola sp.]|uniref:hypothetical protein n=1 Tax=Actinophytocola sp. TaxID=1872138 RepID=UPI003D6A9665